MALRAEIVSLHSDNLWAVGTNEAPQEGVRGIFTGGMAPVVLSAFERINKEQ